MAFWGEGSVRMFHPGNSNINKPEYTFLVYPNKSEFFFALNTPVLFCPANYQYSNPVINEKFSVFSIPKIHSVDNVGPNVPVRKSAVPYG